MPSNGSCITYKILNSLIAPRDSTYLLARLNYFTQQTYSCVISVTLQNILTGRHGWNSLNAAVLGLGSGGVEDIRLGPHDVIITSALRNEEHVFLCNGVKKCLKDSQRRKLMGGWSASQCKKLIFKKSQQSRSL